MNRKEFASLVDISAVRAQSTLSEVKMIASAAKEHGFVCVFALNSFLPYLKEELSGYPQVGVGGVVGFPSGGESTRIKVEQAEEMLKGGCTEIDMVMNIGKLKSGLFKEVEEDIAAVRKTVNKTTLKVIIEAPLLEKFEIADAAKIVLNCGADYVKTGTGWAGATNYEHIREIKNAVGDSIKLKVAGGVRDLGTVLKMKEMGVCRFGIGYSSALKILSEIEER